MDSLTEILNLSWADSLSSIMMALLLFCGIWLTFIGRFFQIRHSPFILSNTAGTLLKRGKKETGNSISPFQAVTTALAGTMGVGNIAGVATALVAGGPGAIFWMWVSAFFGMLTKYAEIYLAVSFRCKTKEGAYYGGPMYYIEKGLGRKKLAGIFALLCALCSLGIGNMTQVNSVATAVDTAFHIPAIASGIVVTFLVGLVVFGGVKRIARVTEFVIPFISIVYLFGAGAFLWIHRSLISSAIKLIVTSAFQVRPLAGGALGFGIARAMRFGLSRGVFTNEAGLGSAPIAHAAADCKSPQHQGVWGVFEVFLDTIVVCTITALVILCADGGNFLQTTSLDGAALTTAAFQTVFGRAGAQFIAISIIFFAVAAMLGWCYYGECAMGYLTGNKIWARTAYRLVFLGCILLGATADLTIVWGVSDVLNSLMALPNIIALIALRHQIRFFPPAKSKPVSLRGSNA